ncbi:hypothetical protein TNCV_1996721 [Trichonephila clavipes]|uniref:Uncharacterized protein n=1 Tax=Trichonephila clavipes TaxID=2585209 RepID=A0A8X6RMI0_TRICX|nr:hypothetical protein TNCV_1996721 [Trichonephila clavipes]
MYGKYSKAQASAHWCGVEVVRGLPAQTSSSSLDYGSKFRATLEHLATILVTLNHGQVTKTTPELASPLLNTTLHQREDNSSEEVLWSQKPSCQKPRQELVACVMSSIADWLCRGTNAR